MNFSRIIFYSIASIFCLLFFSRPVSAIGVSPSNNTIETEILSGQVHSDSVMVVRSIQSNADEVELAVSFSEAGSEYFSGPATIVIPQGAWKAEYKYLISPDFTKEGPFRVLITFLTPPPAPSQTEGTVSFQVGAAAVVSFSTQLVQSSSSSSSGGGSSSGSDRVQRGEDSSSTNTQVPEVSAEPTTRSNDPIIAAPSDSAPESGTDQVVPSSQVSGAEDSSQTDQQLEKLHTVTRSIQEVLGDLETVETSGREASNLIGVEATYLEIDLTMPATELIYSRTALVHILLPGRDPSGQGPLRFVLDNMPEAAVADLTSYSTSIDIAYFLADGIYFFHSLSGNSPDADAIRTQMIMVDTTSPQIMVNVEDDTRWHTPLAEKKIRFLTTDQLSGVQDTIITTPDGQVLSQDVLTLRPFDFSVFAYHVRTIDVAGNDKEKDVLIRVQPVFPMPQQVYSLLSSVLTVTAKLRNFL